MKEYATKTTEELMIALADKRKALREFRFGAAGSKARDVKEARNLRKDIARILTAFNAKRAKPVV